MSKAKSKDEQKKENFFEKSDWIFFVLMFLAHLVTFYLLFDLMFMRGW